MDLLLPLFCRGGADKGLATIFRFSVVTGYAVGGAYGFAFYNAVRKAARLSMHWLCVSICHWSPFRSSRLFAVNNWVMPSGNEWLLLIAVGLLTQIAQVYQTRAYQIEMASRVTPYTFWGSFSPSSLASSYFMSTIRRPVIWGMIVVMTVSC